MFKNEVSLFEMKIGHFVIWLWSLHLQRSCLDSFQVHFQVDAVVVAIQICLVLVHVVEGSTSLAVKEHQDMVLCRLCPVKFKYGHSGKTRMLHKHGQQLSCHSRKRRESTLTAKSKF